MGHPANVYPIKQHLGLSINGYQQIISESLRKGLVLCLSTFMAIGTTKLRSISTVITCIEPKITKPRSTSMGITGIRTRHRRPLHTIETENIFTHIPHRLPLSSISPSRSCLLIFPGDDIRGCCINESLLHSDILLALKQID